MRTIGKLVLGMALTGIAGVTAQTVRIELEPGEGWWGGYTLGGQKAPFGLVAPALEFDIRSYNYSNQTAPLLVSSRGRYLWSDTAFRCVLTNGVMVLDSAAPIECVRAGSTLREAFLAAAKKHFPASGLTPDLALIAKPQWNTWVELTYHQNQKDVLAYAKAIGENGFPEGGVMMIDDTWQFGYGIWEFDPRRFQNPKQMCDILHGLGYKIMLWVCPYVSMDSPGYRELALGQLDAGITCPAGGLLCDEAHEPLAVKWWNGKSASIDFTDPIGADWFSRQLQRLQHDFGVDGFKFDAGDTQSYQPPYCTKVPATPSELSEAYAKLALRFPLNEYRACFKMGGQPIVQRLSDKWHSWDSVRQLIPDMINCGLLGNPFVCPDMIGSGMWTAFLPMAKDPFDPELFVRSAQVHALSPMMQFSAAPWRHLRGEHLAAVKAAAWTRMKFVDYLLSVAKESARTGEPMLRALEYEFPGHGYECCHDQFLLGSKLLVAPQVVKGATERKMLIPPGTWTADDGTVYTGPTEVTIQTPLSRLPYAVKK